MKRFLLLALCAFFACNAAEARTLYVNAKRPNNNGNGFSVKKAKKTIQAAVNIAKKGDTIIVLPGSYAPIKTNNKKIQIKALMGYAKTSIVKPSAQDKKVALAQLGKTYPVYVGSGTISMSSGIWTKGTSTTLQGFLLDGKYRTVGSFGELIGVSGGTVKSCKIAKLGRKYADTLGNGFETFDNASVAVNSKLSDCVITRNYARFAPAELNARTASGTKAPTTSSSFQRCKIVDNYAAGGFEYVSKFVNCLVARNYAVDNTIFWETTLLNCTIAGNSLIGLYGDAKIGQNTTFVNCILYQNRVRQGIAIKNTFGYYYYDRNGAYLGYRDESATSFLVDVAGTPVLVTESSLGNYVSGWTKKEDCEIVHKSGSKWTLGLDHFSNKFKNTDKSNKNPKFVNYSKGKYQLKRGSPFIEKGRLTAAQKKSVGKYDLAGKDRLRGKYIDRGCYEF